MKILIAGDLYIADTFLNQTLIDNSIEDLFQKADFRIVNLEAPITRDEPKNRILKTGPHLRMSAKTVLPFLKQLKVDAVTLANNHILDYGAKGLLDTFDALNQNKIEFVGAGKNLKEANSVLTIEKDGMRIAIINFCENEWSIAEEGSPGANPMNIIDNVNQIKEAKSNHNKVICIIHGGHEYYHLPSPRMQKQYRFYADNGADAIVGHHTHCIGGCEVYNGVPIIYSLGNFIFTKPSKKDVWYKGLAVKLTIGKTITFELFPTKQKKAEYFVCLEKEAEKEISLNQISELNEIITNQSKLLNNWKSLIDEKQIEYLSLFSPIQGIKQKRIKGLLYRIRLNTFLLSKIHIKLILNLMRCDAHSDIVKNVFTNFLRKKL